MPVCPSCGSTFTVLCAEDGLCRNCSDCCRDPASRAAPASTPRPKLTR